MYKFLWSIATVGALGFLATPGQAQVGYYPPSGYGYPAQPGYAQPGYGYPQQVPSGIQYPPGPWKSYYNDPQWQQDWMAYMQRKNMGIPAPDYMPGTLPPPGSPNYRTYFSDPQWLQDWYAYMRSKYGR